MTGPVDWVEVVNPVGLVQKYAAIPAGAEKEVVVPEQITLVPVMLHEGRELTVSVTMPEVIDPHVPLTITLYVFALDADTGEIV